MVDVKKISRITPELVGSVSNLFTILSLGIFNENEKDALKVIKTFEYDEVKLNNFTAILKLCLGASQNSSVIWNKVTSGFSILDNIEFYKNNIETIVQMDSNSIKSLLNNQPSEPVLMFFNKINQSEIHPVMLKGFQINNLKTNNIGLIIDKLKTEQTEKLNKIQSLGVNHDVSGLFLDKTLSNEIKHLANIVQRQSKILTNVQRENLGLLLNNFKHFGNIGEDLMPKMAPNALRNEELNLIKIYILSKLVRKYPTVLDDFESVFKTMEQVENSSSENEAMSYANDMFLLKGESQKLKINDGMLQCVFDIEIKQSPIEVENNKYTWYVSNENGEIVATGKTNSLEKAKSAAASTSSDVVLLDNSQKLLNTPHPEFKNEPDEFTLR